eukprot:CAMPEP_0178433852 /NCGR_PEP_ID=MMETSP0689_2-20121128/33121_1 /TAXON_ID=160604 /ORGANISM="Amphidinium massartii, Strain CS-259" /LENGTH=210 /DNA_ID=CAMNT_0020055897 /DNA_START=96 /DNA_END=728 /DNA_ORIENTATION=-
MSSCVCSRCGAEGHAAVNCKVKTFLKAECIVCHSLGHVAANCPVRRASEKAAYEERQRLREERQAAYEERQRLREERQKEQQGRKDEYEAREAARQKRREAWAEWVAAWDASQQDLASCSQSACDDDVADGSASTLSTAATNPAAHEERTIKKLEKKLREVAKLEERLSNGEHLDKLQHAKLEQRSSIEREIEDVRALAAARMRHAKRQE